MLALLLLFAPLQANDETAAVKACVQAYRRALQDGDGAAAAKVVDKETIAYYARMKTMALTANAEAVRKESVLDRLMIVLLRHRMATAELEKMSADALFAHAVSQGWISKASVAALDVGAVTITKDVASGEILQNGKKTPLTFRFVKEDGAWHFSLRPLNEAGNAAIVQLAKMQGVTEDALILTMTEQVSGKPVPKTIWDAPRVSSR